MIYSIGVIVLCIIAWETKINIKTLLLLTLLFLIGIAMLFEPSTDMDLAKHYQMLDVMRIIGYEKSINVYNYLLSNLPVYSIYFYLISLLQYDCLLLIVTYIIVFSCLFKVISMVVEDQKLSQRSWKLGYVIIMMLANAYAMTGIRYMLAFSVIFLFLYLDLVKKKYRILSLGMYFLMCLLHDGMILIVLLRLLLYIPYIKIKSKLKYIIVLWQAWLVVINDILNIFSIPYFKAVSEKLLLYSTQEATNMWVDGIGLQILVILRMTILILIMLYVSKDKTNNEYKEMIQMLIAYCIGGVFSVALIERYASVTLLFAIPYIVNMNNKKRFQNNSDNKTIRRKIIPILGAIVLYFGCLVVFQYRYFV